MLIVSVKGGNIEGALKEFKRKVQSTKQIEALRDRQTFTKPSVKKRLKMEEAKRKSKLFY